MATTRAPLPRRYAMLVQSWLPWAFADGLFGRSMTSLIENMICFPHKHQKTWGVSRKL
jgi:hypothetical protein